MPAASAKRPHSNPGPRPMAGATTTCTWSGGRSRGPPVEDPDRVLVAPEALVELAVGTSAGAARARTSAKELAAAVLDPLLPLRGDLAGQVARGQHQVDVDPVELCERAGGPARRSAPPSTSWLRIVVPRVLVCLPAHLAPACRRQLLGRVSPELVGLAHLDGGEEHVPLARAGAAEALAQQGVGVVPQHLLQERRPALGRARRAGRPAWCSCPTLPRFTSGDRRRSRGPRSPGPADLGTV